MLLLASLIGGISGWLGASLSALLPRLPAGAVIVLVAASIFLISLLFGTARGVVPRLLDQARLKRRVGRQHLLRAAYEILEYHNRPAVNLPIRRESMLEHRAWTPRQFKRLLSLARREDHLESSVPGTIRLSESGFGEAARITRNHRLWELYLIRHADIAPSHVDRDADMVEHILGAEIVRQLESELEPQSEVPASPHQI
jgi:manganese/zinc/iron transport system permease protein